MAPSQAHHYAGLTPDVVLAATESVKLLADGRLLALNSYENRVYRVGLEEPLAGAQSGSVPGQVVAKFYREGRWSDAQIREEHAFAAELAAAELPVAAPLAFEGTTLLRHAGFRFALFECRGGSAPDLDRPGDRLLLGRTLGRMHAVGALRSFRHREGLTQWRHGARARERILALGVVPSPLDERYAEISALLVDAIAACHAATGPSRVLRLHGDCHQGNILWQATGPLFVDFDDSISGPAVQDLWMLASGSPDQMRREWGELIEGYEQFAHLDAMEARLIEALRATRMLGHAAWIAQRWDDPAFPAAFPWFGEPRYWERHIDELREQLPALDDPPLFRY
jgi:Ser/Thr protein kinase RdoA (MazF antagonist)